MKIQKLFALLILIFIFTIYSQSLFANLIKPNISSNGLIYAQQFLRTELYFGTDKNDGSNVSDEEWNKFLEEVVTPKFPNGFTVLEGYGQFQNSEGKIIREKSKVLILLYPLKTRKSVNQKIEQIRTVYKNNFQQESVLRMDFRQTVRISF